MKNLISVFGCVFILSSAASAQSELPDLSGEWVGTSETVVFGANQYHPQSDSARDTPRLREIPVRLDITGQDGRRVWGSVGSGELAETIALIATTDNILIGADHDGLFRITILPDDRLDLCYTHAATSPSGSIVAACVPLERAK